MSSNGLVTGVPAWAKINLALQVGTRQSDGYHSIDTVCHSLALHDDVVLEVKRTEASSRVSITVEGDPTVPATSENLACKAARLLLKETGTRARVHIVLKKRIPTGGGLGGGSADAAAVLSGLNHVLDLQVPEERLLALGARLGSDVPFMLRGGTARAWGRGELLASLPVTLQLWVVVLKPSFSISTQWAYDNWAAQRRRPTPGTTPNIIEAIMRRDFDGVCRGLSNDLEKVVFPEHPVLGAMKRRLLALGCGGALMSGSGSCLFGITATRATAYKVAEVLGDVDAEVIVTHSRDLDHA